MAKAKKSLEESFSEQESENMEAINLSLHTLNPNLGTSLCPENSIPSGSTELDLVLGGGGYPLGRIVWIFGQASSGKTQLAIECAANFAKKFPNGKICYCDAEAAFDIGYASKLGMPVSRVDFVQPSDEDRGLTVEDMERCVDAFLATLDEDQEGLFILDSLDALPTSKETEAPKVKKAKSRSDDEDEPKEKGQGYGTEKPKLVGKFFRAKNQAINRKKVCFFIISQARSNLSGYGKKDIASGGRAPEFFASIIMYLKDKATLKKTSEGIEVPTGITVFAENQKNKCGTPFLTCLYDISFDYGIDDIQSLLKTLKERGRLALLPPELVEVTRNKTTAITDDWKVPYERIKKMELEDRKRFRKQVREIFKEYWYGILSKSKEGRPTGKYNDDDDW